MVSTTADQRQQGKKVAPPPHKTNADAIKGKQRQLYILSHTWIRNEAVIPVCGRMNLLSELDKDSTAYYGEDPKRELCTRTILHSVGASHNKNDKRHRITMVKVGTYLHPPRQSIVTVHVCITELASCAQLWRAMKALKDWPFARCYYFQPHLWREMKALEAWPFTWFCTDGTIEGATASALGTTDGATALMMFVTMLKMRWNVLSQDSTVHLLHACAPLLEHSSCV